MSGERTSPKKPGLKKKTIRTPVMGTSSGVVRVVEEIAYRAYGIFLARGGEHGHDLDDWLQAEREILGQGLHKQAT